LFWILVKNNGKAEADSSAALRDDNKKARRNGNTKALPNRQCVLQHFLLAD